MREVPSQEWAAFCQKLNQFESGSLVTLELIESDGATREIARDVKFGQIDFGRRDSCTDQISIRSGGDRQIRHRIAEPVHIMLRETEGGAAFKSVIIQGEEGITTLTFRPVIKAGWLENLELR